jgi:hypothetical protein
MLGAHSMSPTHQSPFDHNDLPSMPADRTLIIRPTANGPLNNQERAFNRAVAKVHKLRFCLEEEKRRLDQATGVPCGGNPPTR